MATPTRGAATSSTIVQVDWVALTASLNGDSTITSYHLQWDAGTSGSTWTNLVGLSPSSTATTYTLTTGITAGSSYMFKVRARNAFGWGSYSSTYTIKAAALPSQMLAPTTTIDTTTGGVKITWIAPSSNGDTITAYKIKISNALNTNKYEDSVNCDGSSSTVKNNLYCIVPMSILTAAPYSLVFDQLVVATVEASNSFGFGTTSSANTSGAKIRQVPNVMATPT